MEQNRTGFAVAGWLSTFILLGSPAFGETTTDHIDLPVPVMAGPLTFPDKPNAVDTDLAGNWYVDGVISGIGLLQDHTAATDRSALTDVGNAQIIVQKLDGWLQFYVQAGAYGLPALGLPYSHVVSADTTWHNEFGFVPQAFVKVQPTEAFSVQAGRLPSLLGAEYTFTFENLNIARGLLSNQGPAVSRGVQLNYALQDVAFSLSLNDGYFSGRYNWLSGAATWTIDHENTLIVAAGGAIAPTDIATTATPLVQNNSSIYNLIYTYNSAPWMITPYLQASHVAAQPAVGISGGASTFGAAILVSYAFSPEWIVAGRAEYLVTTGRAESGAANFLYGAGSKAASFTITPTRLFDRYFVRADLSVTGVTGKAANAGFGRDGTANLQFRGLVEAGYVF